MDSKKFKLVLAMTVLTVPLAFTGCSGCGQSVDNVPVDDTVVESTTATDVNETIEGDLADEGIVVTPETTPEVEVSQLDESMSGTYYVIAEEGIPYYAEDDTTSSVLGTLVYDTEVTALGMSTETNLFQIELADGTTAWVSSEFLDTVRGGYTPSDDESEAPSEDPTAPTAENTSDLPSSFAGQDWYEALSPAEKAEVDEALSNAHNGVGGVDPNWADGTGSTQGTGESPTMSDSVLGDGSSWIGGTIIVE